MLRNGSISTSDDGTILILWIEHIFLNVYYVTNWWIDFLKRINKKLMHVVNGKFILVLVLLPTYNSVVMSSKNNLVLILT